MGRESGGELLAAEQPHILQPLVVLDLSGVDGVLQMAVGIPLGVGIPHKGEGRDGVLEAPQELAVGVGLNSGVPEQVLPQKVQAGLLRPLPSSRG